MRANARVRAPAAAGRLPRRRRASRRVICCRECPMPKCARCCSTSSTAPTDPVFLSEKPAVLGRLATSYAPATGLSGLLEAVYTGRAYSLDDDNQLVPLPTSLVLNLRAAYRFPLGAERSLEVYVRLDNATDEVVVPQLGLPDAGRAAQGGVKALF